MKLSESPPISAPIQEYARIWAECTSRALEKIKGAPFAAAPQTSDQAQAETVANALPAEEVSVRFKVSGSLAGEQIFRLSRSDGVRLAQIFTSVPIDGAVAFSGEHTEALNELFRQFAGLAATACKPQYGGAVEFTLAPAESTRPNPDQHAIWEFSSADLAPIRWNLCIHPDLQTALESVTEVPPQPATKPSSPANASNLDLLLDVVLAATLRFGQAEMVLRDILELRPGSVVELNRRVQEPAELLVAGRVIARGEVVIVDGSYGLRITDITQPHQRLEAVET